MSNWSVYLEVEGNPLYASVELDGEHDEDSAWREIISMVESTLEVTKED